MKKLYFELAELFYKQQFWFVCDYLFERNGEIETSIMFYTEKFYNIFESLKNLAETKHVNFNYILL